MRVYLRRARRPRRARDASPPTWRLRRGGRAPTSSPQLLRTDANSGLLPMRPTVAPFWDFGVTPQGTTGGSNASQAFAHLCISGYLVGSDNSDFCWQGSWSWASRSRPSWSWTLAGSWGMGGWGWGGWWAVPLGIGIATSLYAPRRCWSPSYGYYPCRYRYGWGY